MKKTCLALLLITQIYALTAQISTDYRQEEQDWVVIFHNDSSQDYEAMVISGTPQYMSTTGQLTVPAGERKEVLFLYQASEGIQENSPLYIRLISDHPDNPGILSPGKETVTDNLPLVTGSGSITYFFTPDCHKCREFLNSEVPLLEHEMGKAIILNEVDVTTAEGLRLLMKTLNDMGSNEKRLPLIIGKGQILAGDDEIQEGLRSLVLNEETSTTPVTKDNGSLTITLFPIILAGLLDGINPCAFSTLIFLLSWLGLAGRNRKEILLTGIFFTTAVFTTYYAVGLGAFGALRSSSSVQWISYGLKYFMALFLLVLAVIHIFDYRKIRQGRISDITLQLSKERKKKIHKLVREKTRKAGLFTGSIILGIAVTIYELGCTGQVCLPTLMYMARMEKQFSAFLLLGVYNLAFVLPLISVFALAWKGMGSDKLAKWFSENVGQVKILSAFFFLMMAILLLIL